MVRKGCYWGQKLRRAKNHPERTTLRGRQAQRAGPNSHHHRRPIGGCPGTIEGGFVGTSGRLNPYPHPQLSLKSLLRAGTGADSALGHLPATTSCLTPGFVGRPGEGRRTSEDQASRGGWQGGNEPPGVSPVDGEPRRPPLKRGRVPTKTGAGLTVT